jgi:hypothetical protein
MPDFSDVETTALCLQCGEQTSVPSGVIKFQWGKVPHNYKVNDAIVWLEDKSHNIVPSFTLVHKHGLFGISAVWNCGDPQYKNLYVFDSDPHVTQYQCSRCNKPLEGLAVEIRNGLIVQGVGFGKSDMEQKFGTVSAPANIIIIRDDGTYWAREDWDDPIFNS